MAINTFEGLTGSTLSKIVKTDDEIVFTLQSGERYHLYHSQNCCEDVYIEDVIGDLDDLIGAPLLLVEEIINFEEPPMEYKPKSYTWTFYKLATIKGYVTIRWFGESNGNYSETVDFGKLPAMENQD